METKVKNNVILVPTDFTEAAECAISHAVSLAGRTEDKVMLLHVINKDTRAALKKEGLTEDSLREKLSALANGVRGQGIMADFILQEGSIFSTIGDVAESIGARLVVIGTHGVVGVQHLIGSYVLKVASTSPVPVVIVQKKKASPEGYNKIVLPVDEMAENKQLAVQAMNIAKMFKAEVHIFKAVSNDQFINNRINLNVGYAKKLIEAEGLTCIETAYDSKGPGFGKQLNKYAAGIGAGLIMVMNERGMNLSEYIIGPESEKIINNDGQIAVMCLNPIDGLFIYQSVLSKYGKEY